MNIAGSLSLGIVLACCSAIAHAQSVTVLHGSDDARACSHEASLASAQPRFSAFSETSCTRALAYPELYSRRDLAALHINRGILFAAQENYQAAFADYRTAFELKPDLPEIYVNLGNLYFLGEDLDRAIEFYDRSLELGIRRAHVVHLNKGIVLENKGRLAEAEHNYRLALEISPEWRLASERLARLGEKHDAPQ